MYNEKIEALIKAALADGVLTEKEKQVLFKNAQAQGIDLDEFEMVLDARLVELQKAEKEKAAKSAPKSDKYGSVRKCPACGAIVGAFKGVCSECGFEFTEVDANLSSKKLAELLLKESNAKKKQEIIETFPLPNTKADLLEFLTALKPRILDTSSELSSAYYKKYVECIEKAKVSFFGDKQLLSFVDDFEKLKKALKKKNIYAIVKKHRKIVIAGVIAIILIATPIIVDSINVKQYQKMSELFETSINEGKSEDAKAILKSMDFSLSYEKYDKALQLIELYVANKDVKNAIGIYENFTTEHCSTYDMQYTFHCHGINDDYEPKATKLIRGLLIEVGDYDKAWQYHPLNDESESSPGNAWSRYEYMVEIVNYLCQNNRKTEARQFIRNNISWFVQYVDPRKKHYPNAYESCNSQTARAKLLRIVDSY